MTSAVFIIDCGLSSGLGHVRRSLVLASSLRESGIECKFYVTSDIALPMLQRFGFKSVLDLEETLQEDLLVVDGNSFTKKQILKWSQGASLMCVIDDNGVRPIKADIVINPNLYAKTVSYRHYDVDHLLLGPENHLVALDFFEQSSERDIEYLVCFGGTDDGRLAGPLIKRLQRNTKKQIVWAVPSHIEPQADLVALAGVCLNFTIEIDAEIPKLLSRSKAYIGGAGTMVTESLAAGCRVISCAIVPNQDKNIEFLNGLGLPAFKQFDVDMMLKAAAMTDKVTKPTIKLHKNASQKIADYILECLKG